MVPVVVRTIVSSNLAKILNWTLEGGPNTEMTRYWSVYVMCVCVRVRTLLVFSMLFYGSIIEGLSDPREKYSKTCLECS